MASKISGFKYPDHGMKIFAEDFRQEQSAISDEIVERFKKVFGNGVIWGGAVTISATALKVDVAEFFGFDPDGKMVYFPTQTGEVTLAEGTNTIVARHKFVDVEYNRPFSSGQVSQFQEHSFEIIARTSGAIAGDIPLRTVTMASGVRTLGADLRTYADLQAKINRIDELGATPAGSFADIATRLQFLDNYLKVGKIEWFDQHFAPDASNPWLALTNADATLSEANWPDLVPYYRAKILKYMPGTSAEKSAFDVTHYTRASNVVTITLANTAAELAILAALAEENLVHGSFSSWIPLTLPLSLGAGDDVPAGDYAITALDAVARTISFAHTGANIGSTGVSRTVQFYPHRIPGSTTTCRHYQISGRTLVSTNDTDGEVISGLRRRDRMQGFNVVPKPFFQNFYGIGGSSNISSPAGGSGFGTEAAAFEVVNDGVNGPPRSGKTTDPRALGAVPFIWARRYAV